MENDRNYVFVLRDANTPDGCWRAVLDGELLPATWNSKGAAEAGLAVERRRAESRRARESETLDSIFAHADDLARQQADEDDKKPPTAHALRERAKAAAINATMPHDVDESMCDECVQPLSLCDCDEGADDDGEVDE